MMVGVVRHRPRHGSDPKEIELKLRVTPEDIAVLRIIRALRLHFMIQRTNSWIRSISIPTIGPYAITG